ncbi:MAG: hypothetical protein GC203_22200 [Phenylobacterium sp.]|nr:hypothetical protein [Phenylobacterium sp.]
MIRIGWMGAPKGFTIGSGAGRIRRPARTVQGRSSMKIRLARRLAPVIALLAAAPAAATAAELTANAKTVVATFAKAKPGDVLRLKGEFPALLVFYAKDRTFSPALTVDATDARLSAVIFNGVTGIRWNGGVFTGVPGRPAFSAANGGDIKVSQIDFRGDGTINAVVFRNMKGVALADSRLDRPRVGVSLVDVEDVSVVGNTIQGWSGDGIGLAGVTRGEIRKNSCRDPVRVEAGLHIDCIQGYFAHPRPNSHILVTQNYVTGFETQGVFFNAFPGYPPPDHIVAEENTVETGDAPNGVALDGGPTNIARNNRTSTLKGSRWRTDVKVFGGSISCGNKTEAYLRWKSVAEPPCKDAR